MERGGKEREKIVNKRGGEKMQREKGIEAPV